MTKIYTKSGDDGTTGLIGGTRVSKGCLRVDAYGSLDELNALLGVLRSLEPPERVEVILLQVQNELFTIAATLALPDESERDKWGIPVIAEESVQILEKAIDEAEAELKPLSKFIIPGGSPRGAWLHLARTVARRAERRCVALAATEAVSPVILRYLNRLSDLCFVLARLVNRMDSHTEIHPTFREED